MGATEGQDLPLASDRRRHWTTDRRRRHGLDAEDHCYLCDQYLETIDHIIVSCSFSRQVWGTILAMLGADASQVGGDSLLAWWEQWRRRWHGDKKKGAEPYSRFVAWEIWKERNARCFRSIASTVDQILSIIKQTAYEVREIGRLRFDVIFSTSRTRTLVHL
jgi:hypothetical protein